MKKASRKLHIPRRILHYEAKIRRALRTFVKKQKEWKLTVPFSDEEHTCQVCGASFRGNYCPQCGTNSAGGKRESTKSTLLQYLDTLWGIGSMKFPRTAWHLIWRPGYMIGDYLDGKRQPYCQPIAMLIGTTLFYTIILSFFGISLFGTTEDIEPMTEEMKSLAESGSVTASFIGQYFSALYRNWQEDHVALALFTKQFATLIFTYLLFRKSPSHPKTNLAENIVILLYMICLMEILSMIWIIPFGTSCPDSFFLPFEIKLIMFFIVYRQLFGFRNGRTFWKALIVSTVAG